MLIKDLILAHPVDEIYPIYHAIYYRARRPILKEEQDRLEFYEMYDKLQRVEPVINGDIVIASKLCLLGHEYIDTSFYEIPKIQEEFRIKTILSTLNTDNVKELSTTLIQTLAGEAKECIPESYDIHYFPWAETLGFEIPDENLKAIGEIPMLARLLFDIAFFGYTEEDIMAEREDLLEEMELEIELELGTIENDENEFAEDEDDEMVDLEKIIEFTQTQENENDKDDKDSNLKRSSYIEELFNYIAIYNSIKSFCAEIWCA